VFESARVEVKIGPASLSSLYHAHMSRAMIRTYMRIPDTFGCGEWSCWAGFVMSRWSSFFIARNQKGNCVASGFVVFQQHLCDQRRQFDRGIVDYKWLARDDANAENSCLWVIWESYRLGVVEYEDVGNDGSLLRKKWLWPTRWEKGYPCGNAKEGIFFQCLDSRYIIA
jgi:hypothetical protein